MLHDVAKSLQIEGTEIDAASQSIEGLTALIRARVEVLAKDYSAGKRVQKDGKEGVIESCYDLKTAGGKSTEAFISVRWDDASVSQFQIKTLNSRGVTLTGEHDEGVEKTFAAKQRLIPIVQVILKPWADQTDNPRKQSLAASFLNEIRGNTWNKLYPFCVAAFQGRHVGDVPDEELRNFLVAHFNAVYERTEKRNRKALSRSEQKIHKL